MENLSPPFVDYRPMARLAFYRTLDKTAIDRIQLQDCTRPFRGFQLSQEVFRSEMYRKFNAFDDLHMVAYYIDISCKSLDAVVIADISFRNAKFEDLKYFVHSLLSIARVDFRRCILPPEFFALLNANSNRMLITELRISGVDLTMHDVQELKTTIASANKLLFVGISSCNIDKDAFRCLASGVHCSCLVRGFECNQMAVIPDDSYMSEISSEIAKLIWNREIFELRLQNCGLRDIDMVLICEYISRPGTKLITLDLAYNELGCDSIELLLQTMANHYRINHLNLAGNKLGSHGAELISRYVHRCCTLLSLDITYNHIGHEAMNTLLNSLSGTPYLKAIKICGNEIAYKTIKILYDKVHSDRSYAELIDLTVKDNGNELVAVLK